MVDMRRLRYVRSLTVSFVSDTEWSVPRTGKDPESQGKVFLYLRNGVSQSHSEFALLRHFRKLVIDVL